MNEPMSPVRRLARPALVSFDVFDDVRRRRVRNVLRSRGDWFQQSLWIVERSSRVTVDELTGELQQEFAGGDRALVHRPCSRCVQQLHWTPVHRTPMPAGNAITG